MTTQHTKSPCCGAPIRNHGIMGGVGDSAPSASENGVSIPTRKIENHRINSLHPHISIISQIQEICQSLVSKIIKFMLGCNFCLENKKLKGAILAQDDFCYIVESIDPILKDAVMIITKRHVESPFEINEQEWASIRKYLGRAKKILDRANPDGFIIGWNVKETAGQRVSHAHLHVIARFKDEPLAGKGICYFFKQESNKRRSKYQ